MYPIRRSVISKRPGEGWFIKAGEVVYWVKNTDFERGDSESFRKFIASCVREDAGRNKS